MGKVSKKSYSAVKTLESPKTECDIDGSVIKFCVLLTAGLCVISTIVFDISEERKGIAFPIMGLICVVGVAIYLAVKKKLTVQNIVMLMFVAGFILRLNYVLYTPLTATTRIRQHDLYEFGGSVGHSAYIEFFYNNGFKLPDFDPTTKAQFYHPPLHHFLAALWMRLLTTFGMGYDRAISSLQFLSLFYSTCCMFVCERIFTKLKLNGFGKILALSVITFHPIFIILAGSVNNDILSILLTLLAIYTTLRWYEDSTPRNILLIALSIGLGMSTKLSVALVSIPIAVLFLIKLITEKKKIYDNIGQYCIFGSVCLPLGLWFSVRNFIRFKVPFTYVNKLSETSEQYIGFRSTYERLFDFSYHPFKNIFLNRISTNAEYYEYNPFVAIIKTSLFGEYYYSEISLTLGRILLVLNILLIAVSLITMVYCIIRKSDFLNKTMKLFFGGYWLLLFVNFIVFCFQYPHNCSMDFRYIVPTLVIGSMFIGMFIEQLGKGFKGKKPIKFINNTLVILISLFCITSICVYIMLGK